MRPPKPGDAFDEFVSDPAKPVPYTLEHTTGYPRSYPVHDQGFAASRPDVLVYETEPLEEDLPFVGPLKATLHVSTTGTDADWVINFKIHQLQMKLSISQCLFHKSRKTVF